MKELEIDEEVIKIGKTFDSLLENKDIMGVEQQIENAIKISESEISEISKVAINYSIGTTYGHVLNLKYENITDEEYISNQEKQLYYLRKAELIANKNKNIPKELLIHLYTNLGNIYSGVFRTNEAIEAYNLALNIDSNFGMSCGNLATCLFYYAEILYDSTHRDCIHHKAYELFEKSFLDTSNTLPEAKEKFKNIYTKLIQMYNDDFLKNNLKLNICNIDDENEKEYREWCAHNILFLHPMNDIDQSTAIMHDCLHLPNMIMDVNDGLNYKFHGLINEIKQEYISARYLFYEAQQYKGKVHFSDRQTCLIDTLDYSAYSLDKWKSRIVFRSLYSILDKVSFFINEYFDIGIKERDINYKSIWYKENKNYVYKNPLQPRLKNNWGLYGVYWICKDFFEGKILSTNPRIVKISNIRNALEHKYLKVSAGFFTGENLLEIEQKNKTDSLAFYISEIEINEITLWLLKTIRSLIINLISAVYIEESKKESTYKEQNKTILEMPPFMTFKDEWKL